MRVSTGIAFIALAVTFCLINTALGDGEGSSAEADQRAAENPLPPLPRVRVAISKETTYITKPLDSDGFVDFLVAMNERAAYGVTPENNAAIPFWQIVGPKSIEPKIREQFFRKLGLAPLPEKGDYFIPILDYVDLVNTGAELFARPPMIGPDGLPMRIDEEVDTLGARPWKAKESPAIAAWLIRNKKHLDKMIDVADRPRMYQPLVTVNPKAGLHGAQSMPHWSAMRAVSAALMARAMLRVGSAESSAAQNDLLACHRLARLMGQGETLVEALMSMRLDTDAFEGDRAMAKFGRLPSDQLLAYAGRLRHLPNRRSLSDTYKFGERLEFINATLIAAQYGIAEFIASTGDDLDTESSPSLITQFLHAYVDWDEVLHFGNTQYDHFSAIARETDFEKQQAASEQLDAELRRYSRDLRDRPALGLMLLAHGLKDTATRCTSQAMVVLMLASSKVVVQAERRSSVQSDLTQMAFARAAHHADHKTYPAELAVLCPKYVAAIPTDRCSGKPFQYKLTKWGYRLYSVGDDGHDDGGRGAGEFDLDKLTLGDDITVEVP